MLSLIKVDPDPVLKEGRPEGSLHAEDYTWEYGTEHLEKYRFHAERFYQLFCARYKSHNLTRANWSIMACFSWKNSVPIVRFQAEAGEHANYLHSTFYYAHTTRHGGKGNCDPVLSTFEASWCRLCQEVIAEGGEMALHFQSWLAKHRAAVTYVAWFLDQTPAAVGWFCVTFLKPRTENTSYNGCTPRTGPPIVAPATSYDPFTTGGQTICFGWQYS